MSLPLFGKYYEWDTSFGQNFHQNCTHFCSLTFFLFLIFSQVRHILLSNYYLEHTMFKTLSNKHNAGKYSRLTNLSDCQMAGEIITILNFVCLKPIFQSLFISPKFLGLKNHQSIAMVLMKEGVWDFLFSTVKTFLSYHTSNVQITILLPIDWLHPQRKFAQKWISLQVCSFQLPWYQGWWGIIWNWQCNHHWSRFLIEKFREWVLAWEWPCKWRFWKVTRMMTTMRVPQYC